MKQSSDAAAIARASNNSLESARVLRKCANAANLNPHTVGGPGQAAGKDHGVHRAPIFQASLNFEAVHAFQLEVKN